MLEYRSWLGSFRARWRLTVSIGVLVCAALVPGMAGPARAGFPGANGRIAYSGNDIYAVNSDGSEKVNLTNTPDSGETEPAWSPDGTRIAYAREEFGDEGANFDIYVMNADGSNPVRLTQDLMDEEWPAWSPDGQYIVFSRGEEFFGGQLLIMKADGSQVRQLIRITTTFPLTQPAWSPDGNLIAFSGPTPGYGIGIYVIKPDGTGRKKLTDSGGGYDLAPNWSPDGKKIVFSRRFNDTHFVWIMNADGSGLMPITGGTDDHPAWSPDQTRIVFQRFGDTDSWDIWSMNSDGSGQSPVSQLGGDEMWPDWQALP